MENTNWKPNAWISLLLAFLVGPFTFLYMNSAKWFWGLLALLFAAVVASFYVSIPLVLLSPVLCLACASVLLSRYQASAVRRWYSTWWFVAFFFFFLFIFLLRSFLFEPFRIPAGSMAPALTIGSTVIVKKIGYGSYGTWGVELSDSTVSNSVMLNRGDVYVFQFSEKKVPYIKRLIGLPGDKIEIDGNDVYLNNKILEKKLLSTDSSDTVYQEILGDKTYQVIKRNKPYSSQFYSVTVPKGHYFFMGDNRDNSADSRHYGSISKDDLIGRLVYVIRK